ncbi:MAG: NAD(P)/FAD-dependent oxidoreductase, partial [Chlamydiae bacterium]|nr:NAD(P)/FAD-dependent oxidoreductase [Chlamydiota bacterium]
TDALTIREKVLTSFEIAERCPDLAEAYKYLTFAIVGGGPTGVELAGTFAEICKKTLKKNFSRISSEKARIILIEGFNRILPPFHPALSHRAKLDLEKLGVEVLTECKVTNINEEGIQTDTGFIPCKNILWAAGNQASPLLKTLHTECDRSGRVLVDHNLNIPGHNEIFVIGDAANFQYKGAALPAVAPAAKQQGTFVGKLVYQEISKKHLSPLRKKGFSYLDKGGLATIGTWKAVGYFKNIRFKGILAWLIWGFVHIAYLIGHRNKISVMLEWCLHTWTGKRGSRVIYGSIEEKIPKPHKK